jgi:hypothetical protein
LQDGREDVAANEEAAYLHLEADLRVRIQVEKDSTDVANRFAKATKEH